MDEKACLFYFFDNYQCDYIRAENQNVSDYLKQEYRKFLDGLKIALDGDNEGIEELCNEIKSNLDFIEDNCKQIAEVVEKRERGFFKQACDQAFKLFNNWESYIFSARYLKDNFYRIRKGDFSKGNENIQRKELFHAPINKNKYISSGRYSISGYPCLYLSDGLGLSWLETGAPNNFSYAVLNFCQGAPFNVIDFSITPNMFHSSYHVYKQYMNNFGIKYIISFPFQLACSLKVKNRSDAFKAEYIIPQILMQWLLEKSKYDGIKYKSSLNSSTAKKYGYSNYVYPTKSYRTDGFDEKLVNSFELSNIEYVKIKDWFDGAKKEFDCAKELRNKLVKKNKDAIISRIVNLFDEIENCKENIINGNNDEDNYSKMDDIYRNVKNLKKEINKESLEVDFEVTKLIEKIEDLHYDIIPLFIGKNNKLHFKKIGED